MNQLANGAKKQLSRVSQSTLYFNIDTKMDKFIGKRTGKNFGYVVPQKHEDGYPRYSDFITYGEITYPSTITGEDQTNLKYQLQDSSQLQPISKNKSQNKQIQKVNDAPKTSRQIPLTSLNFGLISSVKKNQKDSRRSSSYSQCNRILSQMNRNYQFEENNNGDLKKADEDYSNLPAAKYVSRTSSIKPIQKIQTATNNPSLKEPTPFPKQDNIKDVQYKKQKEIIEKKKNNNEKKVQNKTKQNDNQNDNIRKSVRFSNVINILTNSIMQQLANQQEKKKTKQQQNKANDNQFYDNQPNHNYDNQLYENYQWDIQDKKRKREVHSSPQQKSKNQAKNQKKLGQKLFRQFPQNQQKEKLVNALPNHQEQKIINKIIKEEKKRRKNKHKQSKQRLPIQKKSQSKNKQKDQKRQVNYQQIKRKSKQSANSSDQNKSQKEKEDKHLKNAQSKQKKIVKQKKIQRQKPTKTIVVQRFDEVMQKKKQSVVNDKIAQIISQQLSNNNNSRYPKRIRLENQNYWQKQKMKINNGKLYINDQYIEFDPTYRMIKKKTNQLSIQNLLGSQLNTNQLEKGKIQITEEGNIEARVFIKPNQKIKFKGLSNEFQNLLINTKLKRNKDHIIFNDMLNQKTLNTPISVQPCQQFTLFNKSVNRIILDMKLLKKKNNKNSRV